MIIIHKINDFLFNLFPQVRKKGNSLEALKDELVDYYTFGPFRPKVDIEGDFVKVEIDTSSISNQKSEFDLAIKHCERGNFTKAKPILEKLIKRNPSVSEYHRILGQIYSEEGNQNEAINCLTDALRWDPRNAYALIMMGNIFARPRDDIDTAMTYYKQALAVKPDDYIAMNNIGANLMNLGRMEEAEQYFESALQINSSYPNTLYALAMIQDMKGNLQKSFDLAIQSIKNSKANDPIYKNAIDLATEVSSKISKQTEPSIMFKDYAQKLELDSGKKIDLIEDRSIPTEAKLEIAENYNRDRHMVKYKRGSPRLTHLIMHELVHLDLTVQARKRKENFLFVSTNEHKELFIRDNEPLIRKLNQEGIPDNQIADFINALFNGMNSQMFNASLDLFIEDFLYRNFTDLRPVQFLSLLTLQKEYIDSASNKQVLKYSPLTLRNANLILNLVHCLQFKELFGYDLIPFFKTTSHDLNKARKFFNEYSVYQKNDQALESYKLTQRWAEELKIDKYFSMVEENEYRSKKADTNQLINKLDEEHLDIKSSNAENALKQPLEYEDQSTESMAVVMYCLSALQYFEPKNLSEIRQVGFEIGLLGTRGINPSNTEKKYYLKSIPGKGFTGLQLLAYMYVAFQLIEPSLDTGLNFKKEYEIAKTMHKKGSDDRDTRDH